MLKTAGLPVEPAAAEAPSDAKVYPTKFSDLNSYFQALQTRLAVTIALTALVAAVVGAVRPLLVDHPLPPGTTPYIVWAGLGALVLAFFLAAGVLAMPSKLPLLIEGRLASRSLGSPDEVDRVLHDAFMKEIRRRHNNLHIVHSLLGIGAIWLLLHVAVALWIAPWLSMAPPPGDALCAAISSPIATAACGFDILGLGIVVVTGGPLLLALPFERLRWWWERRRLAAAATASAPVAE